MTSCGDSKQGTLDIRLNSGAYSDYKGTDTELLFYSLQCLFVSHYICDLAMHLIVLFLV